MTEFRESVAIHSSPWSRKPNYVQIIVILYVVPEKVFFFLTGRTLHHATTPVYKLKRSSLCTFCGCHKHLSGIFDAASTFIPCQDHNFVGATAVQLKTITCYVWLSEGFFFPCCQLISENIYGFPVMDGVSGYGATVVWRGHPWKVCVTTLWVGWYCECCRYT